jgi:hypothetical protein
MRLLNLTSNPMLLEFNRLIANKKHIPMDATKLCKRIIVNLMPMYDAFGMPSFQYYGNKPFEYSGFHFIYDLSWNYPEEDINGTQLSFLIASSGAAFKFILSDPMSGTLYDSWMLDNKDFLNSIAHCVTESINFCNP